MILFMNPCDIWSEMIEVIKRFRPQTKVQPPIHSVVWEGVVRYNTRACTTYESISLRNQSFWWNKSGMNRYVVFQKGKSWPYIIQCSLLIWVIIYLSTIKINRFVTNEWTKCINQGKVWLLNEMFSYGDSAWFNFNIVIRARLPTTYCASSRSELTNMQNRLVHHLIST